MFFDSQVRFMIKESIEHVGCVAHRSVIVVRDMRAEGNPRTTAVTNVDLAGVFTAPTDVKILPVRRGGCPRAPMAGKG